MLASYSTMISVEGIPWVNSVLENYCFTKKITNLRKNLLFCEENYEEKSGVKVHITILQRKSGV